MIESETPRGKGGFFLWAGEYEVNQYVQFIHAFDVHQQSADDVHLNISADSQYVAWINGRIAGFGQYADYQEYKVYDSIPVGHLLQPGKNTLCVLGYCQNEDSSVYRKGTPGVWFEIVSGSSLLSQSGHETICRAAPDYVSGEIERISGQLSFSFRYDAREFDGWNKAGYSPDASWSRSVQQGNDLPVHPRPVRKLALGERKGATLCAQGVFLQRLPASNNMGERMQYAFLAHRDLHVMTERTNAPGYVPDETGISFHGGGEGDGIYAVLDLGEEEAGFIDLEIEAVVGTMIDFGYGEHLDDLRVRSSVGGRTFAAHYICREGRQTFTHFLKRAGCRYVQLHVYADSFKLYYAGLRPTPYPLDNRGAFRCSDSLHNKIYDVSVRTLQLCMHEHYEDSPWREQALYSMDSRNQMLCGYYCFGEYDFAKSSIRLMGLSLRPDGLLELCSPARVPITIPAFSLVWILQLYEYVLYSGDLAFGHEMYEIAQAVGRTFTDRVDETGLIPCFQDPCYWNFYEWADGLDGSDIIREFRLPKTYDAPLNAFYSTALQSLSRLAVFLGAKDDAAAYLLLRDDINERIAEAFWVRDKQMYCTFIENGRKRHFAELTQSLAVYCGACPEDRKETVLRALCTKTGELVPITLSSAIFKYDALLTLPEYFGFAVIEEMASVWGDMLFKGATSFWETERGAWDFSRAGSLCHAWSAIPAYFYHAYILGMKPAVPGFAEYDCRPVPSGILQAEGTVPAPACEYRVRIAGDQSRITVSID